MNGDWFSSTCVRNLRACWIRLDSCLTRGKRLDEVERTMTNMLLKVGRASLVDYVNAAGDGDKGPTLEKNGVVLKRMEEMHSRSYRSIFGVVTIERYVYSERKHQKHEAVPLDQKLGLPADETSYLLEEWMTSLATQLPYSTAAKWLHDTFGIVGNSTTIENRIRKMGQHVASFRQEVVDEIPEDDEVIAVLADAKGIPIRTPWEQVLQSELGRKPHVRHHRTSTSERRAVGCAVIKSRLSRQRSVLASVLLETSAVRRKH